MADELGIYCGEVLKRERVGDLKCYFVQTDNPKFRYNNVEPGREREIDERKLIVAKNTVGTVGFALVWWTDMIVGKVKSDLRGLEIRDYEFPTLKEIPFNDVCPINAEIIGSESKILRHSSSKEEYLSDWCLQTRFEQHHQFKL